MPLARVDPAVDQFLQQLAVEAVDDLPASADEHATAEHDTAPIQHGLTSAVVAANRPADASAKTVSRIQAGIDRRTRQTRRQGVLIAAAAVLALSVTAGATPLESHGHDVAHRRSPRR